MTAPTPTAGDTGPAAAAPSTALVLVNLGTPAAPTARAVRAYLGEFLADPRVVDLPRWLWRPLLELVILPLRGPRVAKKYAGIWLPEGSPLAVYTQRLAEAVQRECPQLRVVHAMRYGAPSLRAILQQLQREGVRQALVLPLYPQYSTTTTASVADVLQQVPALPTRLVEDYHLDAGWVDAIAAAVRAHRATHGNAAHLLFSFHGLPQRLAERGDPYPLQCQASARAIAERLGLRGESWTLTYQSRFGREKWLEPATADTLAALAARGIRSVDVVAPGFAVDCLETLEEVAQMLREDFAGRGGELRYIPCLNDSATHARALASIARRALALPA